MKIFLCWSGDRSRHVVESFDWLLKQLNQQYSLKGKQAFVPFRSANIEKGLPWFQAVENELSQADAALVAITPENCASPWMHYEAGAVANRMGLEMKKGKDIPPTDTLKGRLFTYLFGMDAGDLKGPLAAYQSTTATYEDTRALVRRLLAIAGVKLPTNEQDENAKKWEKVFRLSWNRFVERLRPCQHQQLCDLIPDFANKFHRLTFKEPVALCHRQAWTDRIKGCHEVLTDLQCRLDEIKERCRPFEAALYQELLMALDGYEMTMQAYLVADKPFSLGKKGKLTMDGDIEWVCENRRHVVLQAYCDLLDPQSAPVFDESAAFARLETFPEKKNVIHRKAAAIRSFLLEQKEAATSNQARSPQPKQSLDSIKIVELENPPALPGNAHFAKAVQSSWDFDRTIYYLTHAESLRSKLPPNTATLHGICVGLELQEALLRWLNDETETIRARGHLQPTNQQKPPRRPVSDRPGGSPASPHQAPNSAEPSRIPLSYALSVLKELVESSSSSTDPSLQISAVTLEEYKKLLDSIIKLEGKILSSQVRSRAELISQVIDLRLRRLVQGEVKPRQPRRRTQERPRRIREGRQ